MKTVSSEIEHRVLAPIVDVVNLGTDHTVRTALLGPMGRSDETARLHVAVRHAVSELVGQPFRVSLQQSSP